MSKEFKIGILTVVAGALLYYGFNFLRGSDLFSPTDRYYVIFPNVSGLEISNPVYFMGLSVGRVSDRKLQQDRGRIIVTLDISRDVTIGEDAVATLANDGFFGAKAIQLDVGKSSNRMPIGDTLNAKIDDGLLSQFEPITDNLNTTITKINTLLDQLNSTDLQGTVEELKKAITTMRRTVYRLEPEVKVAIQEYTGLASSLKTQIDNLDPVLEKTDILMDSLNRLELKETVDNLNETLTGINSILASIQEGEGTVGKLITSDSAYVSLNKLLMDLDKLVVHFNNYPKDFLRPLGRKNKKLKGVSQPGE